MKDQQTQDQFIRLRVQGLSFTRIAAELNVSKPTRESEAALDQVFGACPAAAQRRVPLGAIRVET